MNRTRKSLDHSTPQQIQALATEIGHINYQMGAGHGRRDPEKPGLIHPLSTEISVFGFYERWRALMSVA